MLTKTTDVSPITSIDISLKELLLFFAIEISLIYKSKAKLMKGVHGMVLEMLWYLLIPIATHRQRMRALAHF